MVEEITKKELEEGFEKQKNQIEDLICAAQEQYEVKRFNISIALSILALEELTKLRKIRDSDYLTGKMDLTEWNELSHGAGVHAKKIVKPVEDMLERRTEKNEEHWDIVKEFVNSTLVAGGGEKTTKTETTYEPEMAIALNQLKQACLYLDYKNRKWFSAKTVLSKKELESLAYVTIKMAEFNLNQILLHNRHRNIEVDKNSESFKKYVSDPLFEKHVEFQKLSKSRAFQKNRIIGQSALQKFKPIKKNKS